MYSSIASVVISESLVPGGATWLRSYSVWCFFSERYGGLERRSKKPPRPIIQCQALAGKNCRQPAFIAGCQPFTEKTFCFFAICCPRGLFHFVSVTRSVAYPPERGFLTAVNRP